MRAREPVKNPNSPAGRALARWLVPTALLALLFAAALLVGGPAGGATDKKRELRKSGLQFGVYPGGGVGTVNEAKRARKEDPDLRLASLRRLSAGSPFVVHLYRAYTGVGAAEAEDSGLDKEIEAYTEAGLLVELVARYRPQVSDKDRAIAGFADYVEALVDRYGGNERFVSLQVTNEANVNGAPDAADGAYGSAIPALVEAVLAADSRIELTGANQVKLGFNWAFESSGDARRAFWDSIADEADSRFAEAVDWVGLNSYPGTWSPLFGRSGGRAKRAGRTLRVHLKTLRNRLMPRAGLGRSIPIQVTENGWPTGPGRKASSQANILRKMVRSTARLRHKLNISGFRWFALRDGNSSDSSFENRYGLMNDRYKPKRAFRTYRKLIIRLND